jgi:hypothetical protein
MAFGFARRMPRKRTPLCPSGHAKSTKQTVFISPADVCILQRVARFAVLVCGESRQREPALADGSLVDEGPLNHEVARLRSVAFLESSSV